MPSILRQQKPPPFAHIPLLPMPPIRVKVAERDVQINTLETSIKDLRATLEADSREKTAALEQWLHSQILVIQKEIADCLNAFSAERQEAEAAVRAEVTDLEEKIHILKQANSRDVSALAPVRLLPTAILAEIFLLAIYDHAHSPMNLMLVCQKWLSVLLKTPLLHRIIKSRQKAGAPLLQSVKIRATESILDKHALGLCRPTRGMHGRS